MPDLAAITNVSVVNSIRPCNENSYSISDASFVVGRGEGVAQSGHVTGCHVLKVIIFHHFRLDLIAIFLVLFCLLLLKKQDGSSSVSEGAASWDTPSGDGECVQLAGKTTHSPVNSAVIESHWPRMASNTYPHADAATPHALDPLCVCFDLTCRRCGACHVVHHLLHWHPAVACGREKILSSVWGWEAVLVAFLFHHC